MRTDIEYLRELISITISPTIETHRKSRNESTIYHSAMATNDEVNRLLFSIPYFDRPLCYHLMGNGVIANNKTSLWVMNDWISEFRKRVEYWATSVAWLEGELILIHHPGFMGRAMVDDDQMRLPRLLFYTGEP